MSVVPRVFLIGAGPGDPLLITLKAKLILERADVVLYDYLVHPNLLLYCPDSTIKCCVGKRKGAHSQTQQKINDMLIDFAKQKNCIVRLKGGDPLLFGRGGEEMAVLAQHGIPFEVVPGISSAMAVPSYAGVSLTHRDLSRSIAIVTGTTAQSESLASSAIPQADTLIFLMAITQLSELIPRLISQSRFSKESSVVVIYNGTRATQSCLFSTLGNVARDSKKNGIKTPALLVVGAVAEPSRVSDWYEQMPLSGQRVIVLREKEQGRDIVDALTLLGAEAVHLPLLQFEGMTDALGNYIDTGVLMQSTHIVFTSENGVRYFFDAFLRHGDARELHAKIIVAIGQKTSMRLKQYGLNADIVPAVSHSKGILACFDGQNLKLLSFFIPTAEKTLPDLELGLRQAGATVNKVPVYRTSAPKESHPVTIEDNDWVLFTSGSTVRHFFASAYFKHQAIRAICLGEATQQECSTYISDVIHRIDTLSIESLIAVITRRDDFLDTKGL